MDSTAAQKPNLKTEAIAGITTFFTMAYIVIVNPQILSADGKTGMAFTGVLTATVLICFTMTLLMGVYAKLPFAVAPRGRSARVPDFDSDPADVFDYPGNTLGLYFACGFVSDGRPPPRDSSGDVRAGRCVDRIAHTRTREVRLTPSREERRIESWWCNLSPQD
jgi:hypothetical protein